ncbi:MAG: hypothetical protein ACI9FU_001575 [Granulosicoccus sp.]|jgi:hypothetical protein
MVKRFLTLVLVSIGLASWAQPKEPYVFKHEKRHHMNEARKARKAHQEAALHNYYELNVWTKTMTNQAKVDLHLTKEMDAELAICDMEGNTLQKIHTGKLRKGRHRFDYNPEVTQHRPLVCVLRVDGRLEAMKVLKFNAF